MAGFMSGMPVMSARSPPYGRMIYIALCIKKEAYRRPLCKRWRWCTILGVLISIATAYLVMALPEHHGLCPGSVHLLYRAAFFGTILLGMFLETRHLRRRFLGLLAGTVSSISMWYGSSLIREPCLHCLVASSKSMAENMYRGLWS